MKSRAVRPPYQAWFLLGLVLLGHPVPVLPEVALGSCRCDCCETQLREDQESGESGLQCALILPDEQKARFMSPFRASGHTVCGDLCKRDPNDEVLRAAETEQLDFERFCFYECRPAGVQPGSACMRIKEGDVGSLVKDASGNAKAPGFVAVETPPAQAAPALAPAPVWDPRTSSWSYPQGSRFPQSLPQGQAMTMSAAAAAAAATAAAPWDAMKDSGLIGARAEQVGLDAQKVSDQAGATAKESVNIKDANQAAMPAVLSNAEVARDAARAAYKQEKYLTELAQEMDAGAAQAARDTIKDTLKDLKKSSRAAAKAEGEKKAKKLWEKMKAMAPKAAAAAGKPYFAALGRAMKFAGEYQKRADSLVGMSISMQMDAQMTLGGAQAYMSLGDTGRAQKMFQTAHVTMNMATGLNGQANGFYDAARSIMGTLGAYVGESLQAGYHDAVLWNPDYPPPAPALVFAQESAKTGILHHQGGIHQQGTDDHKAAQAAVAAASFSSGAAPRADAIR